MARFYRLKLETIYFTSTGLAGGVPCRLDLTGTDRLNSDYTIAAVDPQNDGSVKIQTVKNDKKGAELVANLLGSIKSSVFDSLSDLIETAIAAGETLTLEISGGQSPAAATLEVAALPPTKAGFSGDRVKGANFRFFVISIL